MALPYPDQVRWFEGLGTCCGCGKSATGTLRGPRNESYGHYCRKCAEARLTKAERARAVYEKLRAKEALP